MNSVNHLILSSTIDYSTDLICAELEKCEQKYLRVNRDRFSEYEIQYSLSDDVLQIKMGSSCFLLAGDALKSVYFRAPVFLRTTGKPHTVQEQLKRSQWSSFIRNLIVFDKALWVNHPVATYRAENKMYQLKLAQKHGLAVPETYVGNSLPQNISSDCVYVVKSLDTALFYEDSKEMFTYSTMINGHELLDSEIKAAPIIIQEYLSDKTDLRVTVVGNDVFPVAIKKNGQSLIGDWRKSNKDNLDYIPVELPSTVKERLINLMKDLELPFGGVDLALVENTYYFIEVNPTGEWGWLTANTKLPIDRAIVDFMLAGGKL